MNQPPSIPHAPIVPLPQLEGWASRLKSLSVRPLEWDADFPRIASRFESWWAQDMLDRPIFIAAANTNPSRPLTRRTDLLNQPEVWLEAKLADLRQLHRVGDTLPSVRVDFGPALLGGLLGGQVQFTPDTSWTHAFISDDWSNAPDWSKVANPSLLRQLLGLLDLAAHTARNRYFVMTPDLGGSADILLNLRSATQLCMDVIEKPGRIKEAIDAIDPLWREVFTSLYRETLDKHGTGLVHWLGLWSNQPYCVPACDFSYLIGPREFETLFLPDIARQAATVGRAVFHLDGQGSARHIDALLDVPSLQAIQFTPGEGSPSVIPWISMFKKIQATGRSLLVITPPEEVLPLAQAVDPRGLGIWVERVPAPDELDRLFAQFCRSFGCKSGADK